MNIATQAADAAKDEHHQTLILQVRYLGAKKPYIDPDASPAASLGSVKPAVLDFFKLVETPNQAGGKVYFFSMDTKLITDLSVTLGALAHGKHELKLDLIEQLVQG